MKLSRYLDKSFRHKNFTLRKLFYFGLASGIGALILTGITYALTEWAGIWYLLSTIIAGTVAFAVKFIINALWTFNEK